MSIIVNDSIKVSKTNTPTRDGERTDSLAQMSSIATPFVGMRVYVENTGKEYVVTGLAKARINGVTVENAVVDTYVELAYQKSVDELQSTLEDVEGSLADAITAEEQRASAAESELQNNIASTRNEAKSDLEAVESNLAQAITEEEERAKAAEQLLRDGATQRFASVEETTKNIVRGEHDITAVEVVYYKPEKIFVAKGKDGNLYDTWNGSNAYMSSRGIRKDKVYICGGALYVWNGTDLVDITADVKQQVSDLIGEAPDTLDSIHEIAAWINNDNTGAAAMATQVAQNKTDIANEAQRAKDVETTLQANITAEVERAKAAEAELSASKADEDGYHPKMSVGFSDNLVGRGEARESEFAFRASGGTQSIEDGVARIEKIKGNTIVCNQLIKSSADRWAGWYFHGGLITEVSDNGVLTVFKAPDTVTTSIPVMDWTIKAPQIYSGHKYMFAAYHRLDRDPQGETGNSFLEVYGTTNSTIRFTTTFNADESYQLSTLIFSLNVDSQYKIIRIQNNKTTPMSVKDMWLVDLTRMFGAGNEPATYEEFRQIFVEEPQLYNIGELRSFTAEAIETTGFNQWDEEWALGVISNGVDTPNESNILSKNYIPIIQGYDYYLKAPYDIYLACYDGEKNFIGNYTKNDTDGLAHANTVIESSYLQSGTLFVRFHVAATYGVVYKNDICINISHSGYRNGEYEPYQEYRRDLSSILDIKDSDGNALFPDGLKSAGGVHDEITPTQAIKRVGVIEDLSLLNWSRIITNTSNKYRFIAKNVLSDGVTGSPSNQYKIMNAVCSFIKTIGGGYTYTCNSGIAPYDSDLYLYIESYATNTAAELKSALSGHKLYYELKEPIVVDLENPINLDYSVWDFGTEKIVSSRPTSPLKADIAYGFNAVDTIRSNRLSIEDLLARVAALEGKV